MSLGSGTTNIGYWNATIDTTSLVPIDGIYNISVNATDSQGLTNISVINVSITIDRTKANVTIVVPANDSTQSGNMLINASVNDTTSKVLNATFRLTTSEGTTITDWLYAELNSGTIDQGYWNTTFDTTSVVDGEYNVTINATDFAGNQQLVNISQITINNDAPNNSINIPLDGANISGNLFINASVNDTSSPVTYVCCS